jgi:hypothetical protein
MVAGGNLRGARAALYGSGDFDGGARIDAMMRQVSGDALARNKRNSEMFGNLALYADSPEKWATAVAAAKKKGVDVAGYEDFANRDRVIAENGMMKQRLDLEETRRKADQDRYQVVGRDGRVFSKAEGRFVDAPGSGEAAADPYGNMSPDLRRKLAERDAATAGEYNKEGQKAGQQIGALQRLEAARGRTNYEGSWFNNWLGRKIGANVGGGFGVIPTSRDVAAIKEIDAAAGDVTLDKTGTLPGVASDTDTAIIQSTVANSDMTDEAAANVIPAQRAFNQRLQTRAEMYDAWLMQYGSGRGFQEAWRRYISDNRIFVPDRRTGEMTVSPDPNPDWRAYLTPPRGQGGFAPQSEAPARAFRESIRPAPRPDFRANARPGSVREMSTDDLFAIATGKK